jgi:hypothetical protein
MNFIVSSLEEGPFGVSGAILMIFCRLADLWFLFAVQEGLDLLLRWRASSPFR